MLFSDLLYLEVPIFFFCMTSLIDNNAGFFFPVGVFYFTSTELFLCGGSLTPVVFGVTF